MPCRDREKYNAYLNSYMKDRWRERRQEAITRLGGHCVKCGSDKNLQFDHPDPEEKNFTIAKASSLSDERFWEEVLKCQLLCEDCHKEKSAVEAHVRMTEDNKRECACGRSFDFVAAYMGHRRWCRV